MEFINVIVSLVLSFGFLSIITTLTLVIYESSDDEVFLKTLLFGIWLVVAYLIYQGGILL